MKTLGSRLARLVGVVLVFFVLVSGAGVGWAQAKPGGARPRTVDLVDLVTARQVAVEVTGSSIEQIAVKLRRLIDRPVQARIPIGTYFVSQSSATQNMVSTGERSVVLDQPGWVTVVVPVACANRALEIPGSGDRFEVRRSPDQEDLQKLMPVLRRASPGFAVQQAAVWIITDDASYDDLGTLTETTGFMPFGGTRVITEAATARAMKLIEDAGIAITGKAIWRDRDAILQGLKDPPLRAWLQQRIRKAEQGG